MDFFSAMTYKDRKTLNDMPAHSTSGNALVDFYFMAGSSRNLSEDKIIAYFVNSFTQYPLETLKALFSIRDIRGGMGERRAFRVVFRYLVLNHPKIAKALLPLVPEYGRWDDVFVAFYSTIENDALELIKKALLVDKNGLCAKWVPREGKKYYPEIGKKIKHYLNVSRKHYRKILASLTNVVETKMCSNKWYRINYEQVPSVAFNKYSKAFSRHDPERFRKFLESVKSGKAKINASSVFPHDIVKNILHNRNYDIEATDLQWKNLPDYVKSDIKFLPVCDVSGSMFVKVKDFYPITASIALSIYLAERNKSAFKDIVCTFSQKPTFIKLPSTYLTRLADKVNILRKADWGQNTNLEAVFNLMLNHARKYNVSPEDMPEYILILSDMQFDACVKSPSDTAFEMIKRMYSESGYKMPKVIFWNLLSYDNIPVKFNENGVYLFSGFNPSIMKNLLGFALNPLDFVLEIINNARYDLVKTSVKHLI